MPKYKNILGCKYGRLTVVEFSHVDRNRLAIWRCRCKCGKSCYADGVSLRYGRRVSCGCINKERAKKGLIRRIHGDRHSRLYACWKGLKSRCLNKKVKSYRNYGGRGITVYAPWVKDYLGFKQYVANTIGIPKKGTKVSIDRIDNNKGYIPGNIRWASVQIQARNKRGCLTLEQVKNIQLLWKKCNMNKSAFSKSICSLFSMSWQGVVKLLH